MHRLFSTVVFGVVLVSVCASAQTPSGQAPAAPPSATGAIIGTVLEEGTARPIAGAVVSWAPGPGTSLGPRRSIPQVLTGADGRFMLTGLVAGQYSMSARRGGFLQASPGYSQLPGGAIGMYIDLAAGQILSDVKIEMARPGTITGLVLDEAGEPVIGVELQAVRRVRTRGRTTWISANGNTETTDDRGAYRIGSLVPGDYIVLAEQANVNVPTAMLEAHQKASESLRPGQSNPFSNELSVLGGYMATPGASNARFVNGQVQRLGDFTLPPNDGAGRSFVYPPSFYPAATVASRATVLTIRPGETRSSVDISLRPVPAVRISGTVIGPDGPVPFTAVTLNAGDTIDAPFGLNRIATATDGAGAFTFLGVAAGDYSLRVTKVPAVQMMSNTVSSTVMMADGSASASTTSVSGLRVPALPPDPTVWAQLAISPGARDISGLVVTLQPGARLSGRVEFAGASNKPTPQQISNVSFSAIPINGPRTPRPRTRIDEQGELTTQGFAAGEYEINVLGAPPGWSLLSVTSKGIDITQRPLEISAADISDIVITLADTATELTGTVIMRDGSIPKTAAVVLFPADEPLEHPYGNNPRRMIATRASSNGKFSFKGFPPGDYRVIAIDDASIQANLSGDVVRPLVARSTAVKIGAGAKQQQNLTLVSVVK